MMGRVALFVLLVTFLTFPVLAQDRATMTSPIIRTTVDDIILSVDLSDFSTGNSYRLGFGAEKGQIPARLELVKGTEPVPIEQMDFVQGHTSSWWEIPQISARGYSLSGTGLPKSGETLTFRVKISRADAKEISKVFILISRSYGPELWYLEDGVELDQSMW
jgi:hypothetical protein